VLSDVIIHLREMNLLPLYEELNINRFGVRLPKRYGRYSDVTCNMPPRVRDPRRALVNSLPAAFKPCTEGWTILSDEINYVVLTEYEYVDTYKSSNLRDTYMHMANSLESSIKISGMTNTTMSRYYKIIPNAAMEELVEHANPVLASRGFQSTSQSELREVISLSWARALYKFPSHVLWTNEFAAAAIQHKFVVMPEKRYNELLPCLCMFTAVGRQGDHDDMWFQSGTNFKNMRETECKLFKPSVDLLINKESGELVGDDELIGCRADDVENKTLSYRKRGKDGPVADCIACSHTSVLYAMSLRAKGESERQNFERVMDRLPTITDPHHSLSTTWDRGYGKKFVVDKQIEKGLDGCLMAAEFGSGHPFYGKELLDEQLEKWRAKGKDDD